MDSGFCLHLVNVHFHVFSKFPEQFTVKVGIYCLHEKPQDPHGFARTWRTPDSRCGNELHKLPRNFLNTNFSNFSQLLSPFKVKQRPQRRTQTSISFTTTIFSSKHFCCFAYLLYTGEVLLVLEFIIIFTIIIVTLMQGIYTYIPETNYVSREYSVAVPVLPSSSSSSPLCRVFILIFLSQIMTLGNTVLQSL